MRFCQFLEVGDEAAHFGLAGFVVWSAQDRRGMNRGQIWGARGESISSARRWVTRKSRPSKVCAAVAPRQPDHFGFQQGDFGIKPRMAGGDFGAGGLFVNAALAAWFSS